MNQDTCFGVSPSCLGSPQSGASRCHCHYQSFEGAALSRKNELSRRTGRIRARQITRLMSKLVAELQRNNCIPRLLLQSRNASFFLCMWFASFHRTMACYPLMALYTMLLQRVKCGSQRIVIVGLVCIVRSLRVRPVR